MKNIHIGLLLVGVTAILSIAGCGGGNNGGIPTSTATPTTRPTTTPTPRTTATALPVGVARFAGNYSGAYTAIGSLSGTNVSGTFSGAATSSGVISGDVKQDNGPTATARGTVSSAGTLRITASGTVLVPANEAGPRPAQAVPTATPKPIAVSYSTKLDGTATLNSTDSILTGTILTTQSNGNNPRGRFVGIRNMTARSTFAGTYSGSFNGKITQGNIALTGTMAFTVSANGLIRGTFSRAPGATNFQVRPLVGVVDKAGQAQLITLTEVEDPTDSDNFVLVTNTLTGTGTSTGGAKISGTLVRTGSSLANGNATFSATRTSTATG